MTRKRNFNPQITQIFAEENAGSNYKEKDKLFSFFFRSLR